MNASTQTALDLVANVQAMAKRYIAEDRRAMAKGRDLLRATQRQDKRRETTFVARESY